MLTPIMISGIFTITLYFIVLVLALISLKSTQPRAGRINLMAIAAIITHGMFLYQAIDSSQSQNLALFHMMGLTNWLAMMVLTLNSLRRDVTLMVLAIAAFSILSTIGSLSVHSEAMKELSGQWPSLLHIFSAMTAMGLLLLAALQAGLVAFADHRLRSHPTHLPRFFPPLQSLESFLFQLLVIGFILMSVSLFFAFFYLGEQFSTQPIHKKVLSMAAWVTFATLIVGHQWKGWRGVTAAKWTIGGFILLSLGYFGSKLVVELILQK